MALTSQGESPGHIELIYRYVIRTIFSSSATEIMRRNVDFNGLGPQVSILAEGDESGEATLST